MKRLKNFWDDDEWRAKRVFTNLDKKQRTYIDSPTKFKATYSTSYNKSNFFIKSNPQVVMKITSSSSNFDKLKAHIKYISRNGTLNVFTSDGEIYKGKENLYKLCATFNASMYEIPTARDLFLLNKKEKRETFNMVFSMKDYANAPLEKIKEASMKAIAEKYPNNYFVVAMHSDTDNPHCHLCLKAVDDYGKRVNIRKIDLDDIRRNFALELRKLGVEASTKIYHKYSVNSGKEINKNIYMGNALKQYGIKHKAHYYRVISFGRAHFNFDEREKESYYVRYRTNKGKDINIWSDDLERVIKENNVMPNEFARFVIVGEKELKFNVFDKKSKKYYEKTTYKKIWDVSIENRLEKPLKPIQMSRTTFKEISESTDNKHIKTMLKHPKGQVGRNIKAKEDYEKEFKDMDIQNLS